MWISDYRASQEGCVTWTIGNIQILKITAKYSKTKSFEKMYCEMNYLRYNLKIHIVENMTTDKQAEARLILK